MTKRDLHIYGTRAIIEAIKTQKNIDKIFLQPGVKNNLQQRLEALIRSKKISSVYVPKQKLDRLSKNKNHQGAIAVISPIKTITIENLIENIDFSKPRILILLDNVSDARNFGAIIRTAECIGVAGIIIPKQGNAPINADTIKTSAGGVFNVPICKVDHIKDAIFYIQSMNIRLIAASEKAESLIYDENLSDSIAIVMGSEDLGVSKYVLNMVDRVVKLPINGKITSLNVSVACGAMLYEIVRQQNKLGYK